MGLSPMMQQYYALKEKYAGCIILFRLGDFYEMFFEDAVEASQILGLTLTGRDCGLENRAPMCGVPYHAVDNYVAKLIQAGKKIAICEQLTAPGETDAKMLERDVVRVITSGTVIETDILEDSKNNYIASVYADVDGIGLSWADISTGEFNTVQFNCENFLQRGMELLSYVAPSEIISDDQTGILLQNDKNFALTKTVPCETVENKTFVFDVAESLLKKHFNTTTLEIFNLNDKPIAVSAAGGLLQYLYDTQKNALAHIYGLSYFYESEFMVLDNNTKRNLELTETMKDKKKKGSLFGVLDKTKTSMGSRTLRRWIEQPLNDPTKINLRLDSVEELVDNPILLSNIGEILKPITDVERILSKISYKKVTPKDCLAICDFLKILPQIKHVEGVNSKLLKQLIKSIDELKPLCSLLSNAIAEDAPALMKDGGYIKAGFSKELDEYRAAKQLAKQWLANLETSEKEKTGIKTLKTGYNKVFGYYIEVSNSFVNDVPFYYQRKQTLTNGERFITPELKELEEKILNSEFLALSLEEKIYEEVFEHLFANLKKLHDDIETVATIDAIYSLSEVASSNNYCKPLINKKTDKIEIVDGRHPVVESLMKSNQFVTNNTLLDDNGNRTMIITGPNMAGKSTYMRQVALITLMAHIGSFVPARTAEIAITDRIFTRIGASDDLTLGQSTFMVEMIETSTILKNATKNSLIILDEIGRGTSTFDGLSIAWAVMEYVSNKIKAKTLFATHYHELTELEGVLENVRNYRILVKEIDDNVVFLYKIARGGANKSFGIAVSKLAGIPQIVTDRAQEILKNLEANQQYRDTNAIMLDAIGGGKREQISLFEDKSSEKAMSIFNTLKDVDVNSYSPMQALILLQDLVESAKK